MLLVVLIFVLLVARSSSGSGAPLLRRCSRELFAWPWELQPVSGNAVVIPTAFPYYRQCDARWARDVMQTESVCAVGCFLTCCSMMLAGLQNGIPSVSPSSPSMNSSSLATPKTLNLWLRNQMKPDGYLSLDILDTPVLPILSPRISLGSDYMHRTNDLAPQDVISLLQTGKVVVANVLKGAHFVLVTGFPSQGPYGNETAWTVNDPASFALFYAHSAVAGWRIFTIAN